MVVVVVMVNGSRARYETSRLGGAAMTIWDRERWQSIEEIVTTGSGVISASSLGFKRKCTTHQPELVSVVS